MSTQLSETEKFRAYLAMLTKPFIKLCRLRFLQPDGSTAFAIDNNPLNHRSGAFIQEGQLTVNLQNGQRRTASATLSNLDAAYDFNINTVWFGQQIALDEGLLLPNGEEYYLPQGVFYVSEPQESFQPGMRTATYPLVDKWAYLDGTLFGNLEGTYEVPLGTNIFSAMASILNLTRGNGLVVDRVKPIFTQWYNGKTQTLPAGGTANLTDSPYTLRVDSDDGNYGNIMTGLADMLVAWVGYDQTGALRVDASQDDILDVNKPVLQAFTPEQCNFLGATYTVKNKDIYNDIIVMGEALDNNTQPVARAQNRDPRSDTNIYTSLGIRTKKIAKSGFYTQRQCEDYAVWKLKRMSVLKKSVSISCGQMFHITENSLVTITRTDKPGSPVERHLIQGFTRPLAQTGQMTIEAVSVNDFYAATTVSWPA